MIAASLHGTLLAGVAVAAAVLVSIGLSKPTRVPAPCYLVLAGLAVSFLPGIAQIRLPPDVVFYGFLPPLLYAAAFQTAPREVRQNWGSIVLLAFGLTAATLFAVGFVAWAAVAALGAGASFVLGAVVGPTDPVSATSVIGSTSAPERLRTVLEAESLVNDGVALVAFSIALGAVEHGNFSVGDGFAKFFQLSAGGIAYGVIVGFVVERVRRRVHDAEIEIPLSLLTPFVAYVPAEAMHVSGILATVACGVYLGWRAEGVFQPEVRLQSVVFWDVFVSILTSVLFVLLGTQFRRVLHGLGSYSAWTLVRDAVLIFAVVFAVRMVWMFTVPHLVARLDRSRAWRDIDPWQDRFVLGWSGMRGALSLAAALSIPASVVARDELLFLTFTTILATMVLLGIPLPWLLGRLGFGPAHVDSAELDVRMLVANAALRRLDEVAADGYYAPELIESLRLLYESRIGRIEARRDGDLSSSSRYRRLRRELLAAERDELRRHERDGTIGYASARAIERQLDLEETSLSPR
ncbi:MAG TPA: Na+/H+ antiporter [Gaiellaceae bacterium]|nr:Na+/H+ antiporter [Gaiellaceae bacterium]